MPVNRKRIRVQDTSAQRSVIGPPDLRDPNLGMMARAVADRAAAYARIMASGAEQEARALAKRAVFSEGPNGVPQMPEDPTNRMGRIAAQTYDAAIEERFAHQLTTSIRQQIKEAEAANMHDYEAFANDAQARIARMAGDVPEDMAGAFQQISTGLLVDSGISVTMRQSRLQQQQAGDRYAHRVSLQVSQVEEAILAGNMDRARMIAEDTEWIDDIPDHVMPEAEKQKHRDRLLFRTGVMRMQTDLDLQSLNPAQLQDIATRLVAGDDDALMEYFTDANGFVRRDLAARAAAHVQQHIGRANAAQQAQVNEAARVERLNSVLQGTAEGNKEDRDELDDYFSHEFDLTYEADSETGTPGGRRPMHWSDWLTMDDYDRQAAMAQIKHSGFMPTSMRQLFTRLENVNDPAEMAAAFEVMRDLEVAPNFAGKVHSFTDVMPDRVKAIYGLASTLHGNGDLDANESVASAMLKIDALADAEWNPLAPGPNDDEYLYRAMRRANAGDETIWFGTDLTSDNARSKMEREVNMTVFEDIDALPKEKAEAHKIFETYLAVGQSWEDAMEMTRQQMEGRYVESEYMGNVARSAYAPERHYPDPGPNGIKDFFERSNRKGQGLALEAVDAFANAWWTGMTGLTKENLPDWLVVDFPGERLMADPFAVMADAELRRMLAEQPGGQERFDTGASFFKGGRDYVLHPVRRTGDPPIYMAMMKDRQGNFQPVGMLDLRDDYRHFIEQDKAVRLARRARLEGMEWENIWDRLEAGESPEFRKMVEDYYEAMGGNPALDAAREALE